MSVVHVNTAIQKANELLKEYEHAYHAFYKINNYLIHTYYSFGEWVLRKYYPNVASDSHPSIRDMTLAERTSDARTWLIANFMSGRLALTK